MSRHRSPRGRGAVETDRAHGQHPALARYETAADRPFHTPPAGLRSADQLDAPTTSLDLAALVADRLHSPGVFVARRRRPAARPATARRHGYAAAGVTTMALAVVAPATMMGTGTGAQDARLSLSSEATNLGATGSSDSGSVAGSGSRSGSTVSPVVAETASTSAATADLFKAGDRVRRQADEARADAEAEIQRAAAEAESATEAEPAEPAESAESTRSASTDCGVDRTYGGVADSVQTVGNAMECVFPGYDVLGVGNRGGASDHPSGYALDFMTYDGDAIADCFMDNADALGVDYVIWDQQINTGSGWRDMEDRGGPTANHEDHVHISFSRGADPDVSSISSCG